MEDKEYIGERKLFVSIFSIIILAIGAFFIVYNWQQSSIKDKEDLIVVETHALGHPNA